MLTILINNNIIHYLLQNFLFPDLIISLSITCKSLHNHISGLKQTNFIKKRLNDKFELFIYNIMNDNCYKDVRIHRKKNLITNIFQNRLTELIRRKKGTNKNLRSELFKFIFA